MKNYFKKFGIMCVMALAIIGIGAIQNATIANAATIGQVLVTPEAGWKRINDTDKNIQYSDKFKYDLNTNPGGGTNQWESYDDHYVSGANSTPHTIKFNFYGTKFRYFSQSRDTYNVDISFDGVSESFSMNNGNRLRKSLMYEKTGLDKKIHNVVMTIPSGVNFWFDCIDIDSDGYMLPYTEPVTQSITLNKTTLGVNEGASEQLVATTTPAGEQVTWSSSDPLTATVDSNGKVTGVKAGQATITAQIAGTNITATCNINVNETPIPSGNQSIMIDRTSAFVQRDSLIKLNATTSPSDAKVIWSSSDPSIATVDSNGLVTVLKNNDSVKVTITAQLDGTDKKASCELTVCDATLPQSIELNKTSEFVEQGTSIQLHAITMPANAKVVWSSSDPSVATVDANGVVTVFKREDYSTRVTITAQLEGYDKKASCELIITCNGDWVIPDGYKSITLDRTSAFVEQNSLIKLNATTTPSNSKVIWSSSDTSIATVDSNGLVTAPGREQYATVTITAQIDGTDKKASCVLIVTVNGDFALN